MTKINMATGSTEWDNSTLPPERRAARTNTLKIKAVLF